jgi:hypothetical protein
MTVIASTVLEAARDYCRVGLSVIPVCRPMPTGCSVPWHNGHSDDPTRRGKIPAVKWEAYQVEAAHTDQVDEWWTNVEHNVGIVTGAVSQLVVLDADGEAGVRALDELRVPRETWLQRTGREDGGLQLFFRHPGPGVKISNRAGVRPGLDVRGDGGYVVAPPSLHRSGREYAWISLPDSVALAPLTPDLLAVLTSAALPSTTNGTAGGDVIPAGQRNDVLYRLARSMAAKGMTAGAINAALQAENTTRCRPPLGVGEVLAIAKHAVKQPGRPGFGDAAAEAPPMILPLTDPELVREGLDLALAWPNGVRFTLSSIRDGRGGPRGELTVLAGDHRVSWGELPLTSIAARETLRKKLERRLPGPDADTRYPWDDYCEEMAVRLATALRDGEALVTLTGHPASPARELLPAFLYEGESTLGYADGDTGK